MEQTGKESGRYERPSVSRQRCSRCMHPVHCRITSSPERPCHGQNTSSSSIVRALVSPDCGLYHKHKSRQETRNSGPGHTDADDAFPEYAFPASAGTNEGWDESHAGVGETPQFLPF